MIYLQVGYIAKADNEMVSGMIFITATGEMPNKDMIEDEVKSAVKEENGRVCEVVTIVSLSYLSKPMYDMLSKVFD